MPTPPRPRPLQAAIARILAALSGPTEPKPPLGDAAVREHARGVLGPGALAWAAEVAAATTELVVARNPGRRVCVDSVGRSNEHHVLGILLELAGTPAPVGHVESELPTIVRESVSQDVTPDQVAATHRAVQEFWIARILDAARHERAGRSLQRHLVMTITLMMDRLLDARIKDVLAEQRRVRQGTAHQRGRAIEELVEGGHVDHGLVHDRLGIDLDDHHVAVVLTMDGDAGEAAEHLERRGAEAGRALGTPALLRHEPANGTLWLWGSGRLPPDTTAVLTARGGDRVRMGVGAAHQGAEGFRRSHLEAIDAHLLARRTRDRRIVLHRDVALAALLGHGTEPEQWFVEEVLGPLAHDGELARELRDTLRCFCLSHMRIATAASRLGVHRNTFVQRLRRIETMLGHPISDNVPELLCAMTLRDGFGGTAEA